MVALDPHIRKSVNLYSREDTNKVVINFTKTTIRESIQIE